MSSLPVTFAEGVIHESARAQFEVFLDEHRAQLNGCLDGLTEEQVRRSLVPSRTTLLGLVKHTTFVEKVWFDEAVTCRSRAEIGIPATPDESYLIDGDDTIATVSEPTARHVNHHDARRHRSGWTTRSTATSAARYHCARAEVLARIAELTDSLTLINHKIDSYTRIEADLAPIPQREVSA